MSLSEKINFEQNAIRLSILTRINLGNLIAYPLKILCPIVKSLREYNASVVNKYVYSVVCC